MIILGRKASTKLTRNTILLLRVQDALMINTLGQVVLGLFAELKVFHCNLSHKLVVILEFLTLGQVVVVKFHPSNLRVCGRTYTERRHTTTVNVERTIREEIEEQTIIGLLGVRDML
jgi:hypothetical protein